MHIGTKYKCFVLSALLVICSVPYSTAQDYYEAVVGETSVFHVVEYAGSVYEWTIYNASVLDVSAPVTEAFVKSKNSESSVEIEWGREGVYYVVVTETDITGCINTKALTVGISSSILKVDAGSDIITGLCSKVQLSASVVEQEGVSYTYSWEPVIGLDNPNVSNPVFTPGQTTTFKVIVTNSLGVSASDEITVVVSEPKARAGEDFMMYAGETAVLDGSFSAGEEIEYFWFSASGVIESGGNTVHPVVSGFGNFILKVTDRFGCAAFDTVNVGLLTYVPVAYDDFDTTEYRTPVKINVLENDYDADNDIDPGSLRITRTPLYGSAVVNAEDFSVQYSPERKFSGTDYFEYRICDLTGNCDEAVVNVLVNNFRFWIPDAFSPNNDGINDYFEIPGIEFYEGNSIEIFNRWGSHVYQAENYGITTSPLFWDGKSNTRTRIGNDQLPTGTYFYVIDLGNGEKRIAGSVYLHR